MATKFAKDVPVTASPEEPAIDRAHLARYTLGNLALEIEVLGLFASQAPVYLAALREASTASAWYEAAHSLKGSARAVGAGKVARHAGEAEALKGTTDKQAREAVILALADAIAEANDYIKGVATNA